MAYVDSMAEQCREGFKRLFAGVDDLIFTGFPDYGNVGDSALTLGAVKYLADSTIKVRSIYCVATLTRQVLRSDGPVYLNGGGNIAGLDPLLDRHRYLLSEQLNTSSVLIQGPQSVHFPNPGDKEQFAKSFASRPNLKMAVRDNKALAEMADVGLAEKSILMPDGVHMLGAIDAPPPSRRAVYLVRTDDESAGGTGRTVDSVDWRRDEMPLHLATKLRWTQMAVPWFKGVLNPSPDGWQRIAAQRLRRGIALLSPGEVVVTDRLHGMLIALQMGRSVIAIDNNNDKLTKYADTWFGSETPDVQFVKSFAEAARAARV